jgi:hypothetical protein
MYIYTHTHTHTYIYICKGSVRTCCGSVSISLVYIYPFNCTCHVVNVIFIAVRTKACQIILLLWLPDTSFNPRLFELHINHENNLRVQSVINLGRLFCFYRYFAYFGSEYLAWHKKITRILLSYQSVWTPFAYSYLKIPFKFIWSIVTTLGANITPLEKITDLLPQSITNARHAMLWCQPHRQLWPHQYKNIIHEHNLVNKGRFLIILVVYRSTEKSVGPVGGGGALIF